MFPYNKGNSGYENRFDTLMAGVFTIVGSGDHGLVEMSSNRYLFVNSAVLRANGTKVIDIIITDGLLSTDGELRSAKTATGLNAEQSFEMRIAKRDAFSKQIIGCLYIVSKKPRKDIIKRLEKLEVNFQTMIIVSRQDVSNKILKLCIDNIQTNLVFLKLIFWHVIGRFMTITIPAIYRPSTGGIAILFAHFIAKSDSLRMELDGIGNSEHDAYYPDQTGKLQKQKFNNIHHLADQMIIKASLKI